VHNTRHPNPLFVCLINDQKCIWGMGSLNNQSFVEVDGGRRWLLLGFLCSLLLLSDSFLTKANPANNSVEDDPSATYRHNSENRLSSPTLMYRLMWPRFSEFRIRTFPASFLSSPALSLSTSLLLVVAGLLLATIAAALCCGWRERRRTKAKLEACGLPAVYWRPKFVNYLPNRDEQADGSGKEPAALVIASSSPDRKQLLPPSAITNVLPRMERLGGPYGMYGTVYGVSTAVVHVAHPVPAKVVLSSATSESSDDESKRTRRRSVRIASSCGASKAPAYDHFKNFCGDGVFTADGDDWKAKRSAVMHALLRGNNKAGAAADGGSGSSRGYESKIEQEAHRAGCRLVRYFERSIQQQQNQGRVRNESDDCGLRANVVPLLQRTTIGLIYRYITHRELANDGLSTTSIVDTCSNPKDELHPGDKQGDPLSPYLKSIVRIRMIILAQARSIWFLLPRWVYRNFSSMYREEENTMGPIRRFSVQACRAAAPDSPLASLQNSPVYATVDGDRGSGKELSFSKNLIDEAITLLFAGQDTSAATLSWTLHLLSLYPLVQQKLAVEIRTVLSSLDCDTVLTKKRLSECSYLDAVIKESMRLYPVAPFVVRRLPFAVPIKSSSNATTDKQPTVVLPADSLACIWIYGLHRNPLFWSRPDEFEPERWLVDDPQTKDEGITNGSYLPFAVGPRNCVGQPLANIILRSLLARLVYGFEFSDDRMERGCASAVDLRKEMQAGFTVLPQGGVNLTIRKRGADLP